MNTPKAADGANPETNGRAIGSATAVCFAAAVAGATVMVVFDKVDGLIGLAAIIGFPILLMLVDLYVQMQDISVDEMKSKARGETTEPSD